MRPALRILQWSGLVLLALHVVVPMAGAATRIEGEYQLMLDVRKNDDTDPPRLPWDFDSNDDANWNGAQLRFFTTPRRSTEAFFKVEADWKRGSPENHEARPMFQFREAHLRYQWDLKPNQGVESFLFFRQDRYWADSYLIPLVEPGVAKNDNQGPNGSGIRVNTWGILGGNATVIASDFAGQSATEVQRTDDAYVVRLRREFLDKKLRVGAGYNRKVENERLDALTSTSVYAVDTRYQWNNIDYSLEYAFSNGPAFAGVYSPDRWSGRIGKTSILQGEIRSFRLGNARTGYVNFVPTFWIKGPAYRNDLAFENRDEVSWKIDSWYLLPQRAITLTGSYFQGLKTVTQEVRWTSAYAEAYIEFVKGFTGKVYYRTGDNRRVEQRAEGPRLVFEEHDDLFGEVQVESRLAWMRLQGKVRDINLPDEKVLLNLDTSINLSERLKMYNRFSFGSDPAILRKGIFSQLQYRPTGNVEMFLEYGPNYIGDGSTPVDDGDLFGSGDQVDLVKFIIKGQF